MFKISRSLSAGLFVVCCVLGRAAVSEAAWDYSIDSSTDGLGGWAYGGMAFGVSGNTGYFAIHSNKGINGGAVGTARNGRISNGDLILNFTGDQATAFSGAPDVNHESAEYNVARVFAVRFNENDSLSAYTPIGALSPTLGLFSGVTMMSVSGPGGTPDNSGYNTMLDYDTATSSSWDMADLSATQAKAYFGTGEIETNMMSGNLIGSITTYATYSLLTSATTSALGSLDWSGLTEDDTTVFGFSIDLSNLGLTGNVAHAFTASMFFECGNDGVALTSEIPVPPAQNSDVPEPSSMALLGIGVIASAIGAYRRRNVPSRVAS